MANIRLTPLSAVWAVCVGQYAYVDLGIFETLFEVVIDGLIGNLAQQCQIRHAHLLLLGTFKDSFLDLLLSGTVGGRRGGGIVFLTPCALRDSLGGERVSEKSRMKNSSAVGQP